jgi:hypothetical protein
MQHSPNNLFIEVVGRLREALSPLSSIYFNNQTVDVHFEWTDDFIGLIVSATEICRIHVPKKFEGFDVKFEPCAEKLSLNLSINVSKVKHNLYA